MPSTERLRHLQDPISSEGNRARQTDKHVSCVELAENAQLKTIYVSVLIFQTVTRTASNTVTMPPMPPRNPGTTRASRNRNRLPIPVSDSPSDEDSGPDEIEMITTSMLDAISADGVTDGGLRTAQLLRGAVSGRKIASRKAIAALESVEISKLPEGERSELRGGL